MQSTWSKIAKFEGSEARISNLRCRCSEKCIGGNSCCSCCCCNKSNV